MRVAGKETRVGGESRAARDGVSDGPVDGGAGAVSPPSHPHPPVCVRVWEGLSSQVGKKEY